MRLGTLARVKSDGLAATFGNQGTFVHDLLAGATAQAIVRPLIDSKGRVVFLGHATMNQQSYIVRGRLAASGTIDASYGTGGLAVSAGFEADAALGNDDRLYVVGAVPRAGGGTDMAVFRHWF